MRTYKDIYKDYCKWLVEQTGNTDYEYEYFIKSQDENAAKSFLYQSILEMCYDKENGYYYFCKFIIGDLLDLGFPSPYRVNHLIRQWDKLIRRHNHLGIL